MHRVLTEDQILEAIKLRQMGYSKRHLAKIFHVSSTAIWENVYAKKPDDRPLPYRNMKLVIRVVKQYKMLGMKSKEVADMLDIPLYEINFIWGRLTPGSKE